MELQGMRNVLQQLIKLHNELNALQQQGQQLAHSAGQAFEDLMRLVHPAPVPPSEPKPNSASAATDLAL